MWSIKAGDNKPCLKCALLINSSRKVRHVGKMRCRRYLGSLKYCKYLRNSMKLASWKYLFWAKYERYLGLERFWMNSSSMRKRSSSDGRTFSSFTSSLIKLLGTWAASANTDMTVVVEDSSPIFSSEDEFMSFISVATKAAANCCSKRT